MSGGETLWQLSVFKSLEKLTSVAILAFSEVLLAGSMPNGDEDNSDRQKSMRGPEIWFRYTGLGFQEIGCLTMRAYEGLTGRLYSTTMPSLENSAYLC